MRSDAHYLAMTVDYSEKATCGRLHVGCVIVNFGRIVGVGYNSAPDGQPTCEDEGCLINDQGRCIRTVHAEMRAIMMAHPADLKGATLYCTHEPCEQCTKHIQHAGINRIVFLHGYENKWNQHFTKGMVVEEWSSSTPI